MEDIGLLIKGISDTNKNEAKKQNQNEPKFNGVYSRNNFVLELNIF